MISDEDVKKLYQQCQSMRGLIMNNQDNLVHDGSYYVEIFRGTAPHLKDLHPGSCTRHKSVFNQYNIIPQNCFSCYKVVIEPRTVIELFKLLMLFQEVRLPNDNVRKCTVEGRKDVAGTYKGLVYCDGVEEARKIYDILRKKLHSEISKKIPFTLKRGCSEFAIAYPEFPKVGNNGPIMDYKNEWQKYEELADSSFDAATQTVPNKTFNQPSFTIEETRIMHIWLKYAATIGDDSYLKISGNTEEPIQNLKRSTQFNPVSNK